ncbi:sorcin isoform X1 [Coturnix japonica]|uniref:sorcin isoform X1 n=1 Tax=Coturnix japonica TaxID=93934 RepID=UPI000776EB5B|nr:sorcin isoform X1 [Coturnix japonica]
MSPCPLRSLHRHHPTRCQRATRRLGTEEKIAAPGSSAPPTRSEEEKPPWGRGRTTPSRGVPAGRWGSPSVPSAPLRPRLALLGRPIHRGLSVESRRARISCRLSAEPAARPAFPPRRGRVFVAGRGRAGGAVWSSSRRPSIPWTSSGSSLWLFYCSSWTAFNLETCRLMISMLDRDMSGTLGFNEFKELWAVVNGWKQHFVSFDSDGSGTVDRQELEKALTNMGFRLSPQAVSAITRRYSTHGKITFDDYIACCVKLRALTDCFRRRDTSQQGFVNFQYDDFIQCVMSI